MKTKFFNPREPFPLVVSFLVSLGAAVAISIWLDSINANTTLRTIIPLIFFCFSFLGIWFLWNMIRLFLLQRRGRRGYQLRAKITFYFILSTIGAIVLFGMMFFYIIFLMESTFIDQQTLLANDLYQGYSNVVSWTKEKASLPLPLASKAASDLSNHAESLQKLTTFRAYILPVSILSIIILAIPILVCVFYVSMWVSKTITQPVEAIAEATRIVANGNLDTQVSHNSNDEIGDLARHFNAMASRLKTAQQQIKRMERLEAWQEMARRLAHEVKNPLTPIKLSAERLLFAYEFKPREFSGILDKTTTTIINETRRLENLVNEFSKFARLPSPQLEPISLEPLVRETMDFFAEAYPRQTFRINLPDNIPLETMADAAQIKQVLINLIQNAMEASAPGRENPVEISSRIDEFHVYLQVKDSGTGISTETQERMFEPYFTTKTGGTGIGLAIAERIMIEHGGNISYETSPNGTCFTLEFPHIQKEGKPV